MVKHNRSAWLITVAIAILIVSGCEKKSAEEKNPVSEIKKVDSYEKGYDLPIDEKEEKNAEADSSAAMEVIKDIYTSADKGEASNAVISQETACEMMDALKEIGCPVSVSGFQMNMSNHEEMEKFIKDCSNGKKASIVTYELHDDGTVGRRKFQFDGKNMYVLDTKTTWSGKNTPVIAETTYSRIKEWQYTEKGWFTFEYCVPEPPEVSEIVSACVMMRVKPLKDEYLEIMRKYLIPLGYQGNNILSSEWDTEHMDGLDYNMLFEYLYIMKYNDRPSEEQYQNGVPADEFECLIKSYLPVTTEQLRQYAVYDSVTGTYARRRLGTLNYEPNVVGTSVPEIVEMTENEDHTVTISIDAVCEIAGKDRVMSHQLTVKFTEDGGILYLGNEMTLKNKE